jgi:uncharacterized protein YuzE
LYIGLTAQTLLSSRRIGIEERNTVIKTSYDPEADVLHVSFAPPDATYEGAQEVAPGIYVEFDRQGRPIGVEITSVRWMSEGGRGW